VPHLDDPSIPGLSIIGLRCGPILNVQDRVLDGRRSMTFYEDTPNPTVADMILPSRSASAVFYSAYMQARSSNLENCHWLHVGVQGVYLTGADNCRNV
jgi:hypothetical protein